MKNEASLRTPNRMKFIPTMMGENSLTIFSLLMRH